MALKLMDAGKSDWVVPRSDKVVAKGKGELWTYWLATAKESAPKIDSFMSRRSTTTAPSTDESASVSSGAHTSTQVEV